MLLLASIISYIEVPMIISTIQEDQLWMDYLGWLLMGSN
ncbi:hypothetical protein EV11_1754 [Prochlorococcus sp. SS52]|nr:hypothetical protein EV04_1898 [Prochlorococcus marinus str. LG]KGG20518.1 hypothetical protein EV08_1104 [Prochlorococcus marinus str. SS2]KGG24183.1 hypothetical protein EV09_0790 [Prochlorococcus marinus str. SS35]KGG31559.1 hypothetical protein EV10_1652 [Prochlorococcus marinus str. SS51]KGG34625.1 hypothetical protein EV11_1754 [Prochlorococcus sp. SS52]